MYVTHGSPSSTALAATFFRMGSRGGSAPSVAPVLPRPGRDFLQDRLEGGIRPLRSPRHQTRSMQRPLLPSGDAHADIIEPLRLKVLRPPFGVAIEGIAAVDENIALFEERKELLDGDVDGLSCLHQHHDTPREGEGIHKFLHSVGGRNPLSRRHTLHVCPGHVGNPLIDRHRKTVPLQVERKVLPHHTQSEHAKIVFHPPILCSGDLKRLRTSSVSCDAASESITHSTSPLTGCTIVAGKAGAGCSAARTSLTIVALLRPVTRNRMCRALLMTRSV